MKTVTVPLSDLNHIVRRSLENLGLKDQELETVQQVLMYGEMRGSTQGLVKIKERTVQPDDQCKNVHTEIKSSSIACVNGNGHTGMYVLNTAADVAAKLVENSGIALVSTQNTRSSTGAISYYATELAIKGYIAIVLAGSPKVMAIEGGTDPVFGTNPIAIAIPTNHEPLVFDMATAAMTWFAVINARDNQTLLPEDTAYDSDGKPTTDPVAAMGGAIKTFGGAKGSGLALMFEILTGVLGSGSIVGDKDDDRCNTIIAIDPTVLDTGFKHRSSELIERLRKSQLDPSHQALELRLPGEHSNARAKKCLTDNEITIDANLYQHLLSVANES